MAVPGLDLAGGGGQVKVRHVPPREEIRERRRSEYLARWPVERQLEALSEAAMGRPEKLDEMKQGLLEIREALPFLEEG